MRSFFSYAKLRRVMSGMDITVGLMRLFGLSHTAVLMRGDRSLIVPWRMPRGTIIGDIVRLNISHIAKAAWPPNREHAHQMLETMSNLLEAPNEEFLRIDGYVSPRFGEWRLKGPKTVWFYTNRPAAIGGVASASESQLAYDHVRCHGKCW